MTPCDVAWTQLIPHPKRLTLGLGNSTKFDDKLFQREAKEFSALNLARKGQHWTQEAFLSTLLLAFKYRAVLVLTSRMERHGTGVPLKKLGAVPLGLNQPYPPYGGRT